MSDPTKKQVNELRFNCLTIAVTEENIGDWAGGEAVVVQHDRNGRMILCDMKWLDCVEMLAELLPDEATKNRLRILGKKTQRAYAHDYSVTNSLTTARSVLSLLLAIDVDVKINSKQGNAIRELSTVIQIAEFQLKEEQEDLRRGNVAFVTSL